MKTLATILLVAVLFVLFQYFQIRNSIKINYDVTNLSGEGFNFNSFLANGTKISARIKFNVFFRSAIKFTIYNLNLQVFKNGLLVAESTPGNLENKIRLNFYPDVINTIYQNVDFRLNHETIALFAARQQKKPFTVNYQLNFKFLGIPLSKTGIYESK